MCNNNHTNWYMLELMKVHRNCQKFEKFRPIIPNDLVATPGAPSGHSKAPLVLLEFANEHKIRGRTSDYLWNDSKMGAWMATKSSSTRQNVRFHMCGKCDIGRQTPFLADTRILPCRTHPASSWPVRRLASAAPSVNAVWPAARTLAASPATHTRPSRRKCRPPRTGPLSTIPPESSKWTSWSARWLARRRRTQRARCGLNLLRARIGWRASRWRTWAAERTAARWKFSGCFWRSCRTGHIARRATKKTRKNDRLSNIYVFSN